VQLQLAEESYSCFQPLHDRLFNLNLACIDHLFDKLVFAEVSDALGFCRAQFGDKRSPFGRVAHACSCFGSSCLKF